MPTRRSIIGDPALAIDAEARGVIKIDLGSEWQALTGLPFVYAMWSGRDGAARRRSTSPSLKAARDRGVGRRCAYCREPQASGDPAREAQALGYLRDNLKYGLGEAEVAGLAAVSRARGRAGARPGARPGSAEQGVGSIDVLATAICNARNCHAMTSDAQKRIANGGRLDAQTRRCFSTTRRRPTGSAAWPTAVRARKHPEGIVTYIIDRNVNYTNVCVARCNFCAFYRPVGHRDGYVLGFDEIFRKIDETIAVGGVQLLLQGGHNPDLPLRVVRGPVPRREAALSGVQAARAVAARGDPPLAHVAAAGAGGASTRLIAAGLDSIPGGGAEILVDRVRKLLNCYGKASADEWLDVMRHAHRAGLRTTATMMYGTVETIEERLEHLLRLRDVAGRDGRLHRVHHLELSARAHRARRPRGDRASSTCGRSRSRGWCSTTSTTCRRRG